MRFVNEWEEHHGTILIWPHDNSVWGWDIDKIKNSIAWLANIIVCYEPVYLLVCEGCVASARRFVSSKVTIIVADYDRIWVRDAGPLWCYKNGRLHALKFRYEDYASNYRTCINSFLSDFISEYFAIPSGFIPFELEGGNFCFCNNYAFSCKLAKSYKNTDINLLKKMFYKSVNGTELVFLDKNPVEDKSCHIDNILAFPDPHSALIYKGEIDIDLSAIDIMKKCNLIYLYHSDIPDLFAYDKQFKKSKSYVNYYQFNGAVIVPQFGVAEPDEFALNIFKRVFYSKEVIPFNVSNIVVGGGGIHCVTKEIPKIRIF